MDPRGPLRRGAVARSGDRGFCRALDLRRHLDLDDVVLDGIHNQIADGVQAEFPHDVAAMRFHGLGAQVQELWPLPWNSFLRQEAE